MKLLHVVGARPNFPKLAPVMRAAKKRSLSQLIVHTGQHYDASMSADFFAALEIEVPDYALGVGSGTHAVQTARLLTALEPVVVETAPDWVVLYGDVNSTLAGVLVAAKLGVRVAHVEAGLRSFDRSMPEEINRLVTDRLADLLLTPSIDASEQLRKEGVPESNIVFVGNVMVDSLFQSLRRQGFDPLVDERPPSDGSVLVTLHRPSNVDSPERLLKIVKALSAIQRERDVYFAVHPRTSTRLRELRIPLSGLRLQPPLGYDEMLARMLRSSCVITDSGGVQEETTALGVPCFTLRQNTERPITVRQGTNTLVPEPEDLVAYVRTAAPRSTVVRPQGWDGNAGERVVDALLSR